MAVFSDYIMYTVEPSVRSTSFKITTDSLTVSLLSQLINKVRICGRARGCTGCTCTPRAEKNFGSDLQGKVVSAPQAERAHLEQSKSPIFFRKLERSGRWEWLIQQPVFWRRRLKKVVSFFVEEKCIPRENPGYAYDLWSLLSPCTTTVTTWPTLYLVTD